MTEFTLNLKLTGLNGRTLTQAVDLGNFTTGTPGGDFDAAFSAATQIVDAYRLVSDARIESSLRAVHDDGGVTVAGGDATENALMNVYLDNVGSKIAQFYIKAPTAAIFSAASGPNYDVVDLTDADVIDFVLQLSQHAFISDGEQIDTTVNNGMNSGKRVTKKYTP